MNIFDIASILVTLSALLMYINFKYIKLPTTIGLMGLSLILSFIVYLSGYINPSIISFSISLIDSIDFNKALMGGMLSFLLFAGALHVDINDFRSTNNGKIVIYGYLKSFRRVSITIYNFNTV